MMKARPSILFLSLLATAAFGEEKTAEPGPLFHADFEDQDPGDIPGDYFVIDGDWTVVEIDAGKAMKLSETPLIEAQVQVGDSLRDSGGLVTARIKADKRRRSFPRFGVGLHGMSGYRLRLFPAQSRIELVKSEEVVATAEVEWTSGEWWRLELSVEPEDNAWTVRGRAWPDQDTRPEQAQIEIRSEESKFSGKASVTGTPYAGLPIHFDDIEVRLLGKPDADTEE